MTASAKNQAQKTAAVPAGLTPAEMQTLDRMSPTYRRARMAELLRDRGYRSTTGVVETRVEMATVAREGDDFLLTSLQDAGHAWRLRIARPMMLGLVADVLAGLSRPERRALIGGGL